MRRLTARNVKMVSLMPGLEIRLSEECDKEEWRKWVQEKSVLTTYPMGTDEEREESVTSIAFYIQHKASLTAIYKGEIAGMAYLNLHPYRKIAHHAIFTIIVGENFQNLGIGRCLVEHLEKMAKESFGLRMLHLEVYEGSPAIRLYRRMGYLEFGYQSHWIQEGNGEYRGKIFMEKWL